MRFWICLTFVSALSSITPVAGQEALASRDSLTSRLHIQDDWLTSDKAFHFASSAFITAGGFYVLHQEQDVERDKSLLISAGVSLAIGIGKEIYDRKNPKHVASWKDLVADILGIGVALLILQR